MFTLKAFKDRIKILKLEIEALAIALTHPRTPWFCKILIALVVGYALSPIDLIPDFIPILGLLDDLLLLPFGIWVVLKLIPTSVMNECKVRASEKPISLKANWVAASIVIFLWIALFVWLGLMFWNTFRLNRMK